MPIFIIHRVNTISKLLKLKNFDGCETDVRDFKKKIVLSHDPQKNGIGFEKFIKHVKNKIIFFNIKSFGLIKKILPNTKKNNRIFFLDLPFSEINYLITNKLAEKVILRFSRYEAFDLKGIFFRKIVWVWYDFFEKAYITNTHYKYLKKYKKKICLVSPELLNSNKKEVIKFIKYLNEKKFKIDAICTKSEYKKIWEKNYKY
jgi:hypothetical protein